LFNWGTPFGSLFFGGIYSPAHFSCGCLFLTFENDGQTHTQKKIEEK
jgi:hypothetical protein